MAGSRPASTPISSAAPNPARPGRGGHDYHLALARGVDRRGERAGGHAHRAAQHGEQDRLGEELRADLSLGGTERASQADLRAPL